jgi:hypothetical protein
MEIINIMLMMNYEMGHKKYSMVLNNCLVCTYLDALG